MADHLRSMKPDSESKLSRRGIFKWVGEVVAGVSLAGIGLGLENPLNAFAASKSPHPTRKHVHPDCYPCPPNGYSDHGCFPYVGCRSGQGNYLVVYEGGCVNNPNLCPAQYYLEGCC